ncbi:hypothetical protein [Veillonella sp. R32]|uniref:hypothetical protein n=1 Tax=Veillonella sp. R32 TaxID=2021312 RepID=UPI0013895561|nr:hypothetical protein [Veillonella sp. R32]KAF1682083.1 hypothetical protein VER_06930 [Veillonella sp. R32]
MQDSFVVDSLFEYHLVEASREHPTDRVFSFVFDSKEYFVKRHVRNKRWRLRLGGQHGYDREVRKMKAVAKACGLAPQVVVDTPDYFVTLSGGDTLAHWLHPEQTDEQAMEEAFYAAGQSLAKLHAAGFSHGRPVLRDIVYDREEGQVQFLDWENDYHLRWMDDKVMDLLLFIHGYFREEVVRPNALNAAVTGYTNTPGGQVTFQKLQKFFKNKPYLMKSLHWLARFGWIDLVALTMTNDYLLTMDIMKIL